MNRSREFHRYVRNKTIIRKKTLCKELYKFDWYEHDGQYSKGKIHCGCGLCKFGRKYGLPTIRDLRELEIEKYKMKEYEDTQ